MMMMIIIITTFYRNKQGLLPMDYVRSSAVRDQLMLAATMAQENREANVSINLSGKIVRIRPMKRIHIDAYLFQILTYTDLCSIYCMD